jgi:hypothetical protein
VVVYIHGRETINKNALFLAQEEKKNLEKKNLAEEERH